MSSLWRGSPPRSTGFRELLMRRFRDFGVLPAAVLVSLTLLAPRLDAGLRFEAASGPNGGDVRSLTIDSGGTLWAGAYRGVWMGSGGWYVSGLTDRTVSAVAVTGGVQIGRASR